MIDSVCDQSPAFGLRFLGFPAYHADVNTSDRRFVVPLLSIVALTIHCMPATLRAAPVNNEITGLVESLADPDAKIRQRAERRLAELGPVARQALELATESVDPERALRSRELLSRLPWWEAKDPPEVRAIFSGYARGDADMRHAAFKQLLAIRQFEPALRALLREQNDTLRWRLVATVMQDPNPDIISAVRDWDPAQQAGNGEPPTSSALALRAWAWERVEPAKSEALNRNVVEMETAHPTTDTTGIVDQIFDQLIQKGLQHGRFDTSADLLRTLIARAGNGSNSSAALAELFALHAYFGPLKHFDHDVELYGPAVGRPLTVDAMALLGSMLGVWSGPSSALAGHLKSDLPALERFAASQALAQANLGDAAAIELETMLDTPVDDPSLRVMLELRGNYQLAAIDGTAGRDLKAAERIERILAIYANSDLRQRSSSDALELEAQAAWRRMRAARTARNDAEVATQLARLVQLSPSHADIALDVVPVLREQGRDKEAETFFDNAYRQMKLLVDQNQSSAEAANNLAWLCARSGLHLEEALTLANRAIRLEPDSAAYLDTAAEANFAIGKFDEAIAMESKALASRPNDKFMTEQLTRFTAGKTKPAK